MWKMTNLFHHRLSKTTATVRAKWNQNWWKTVVMDKPPGVMDTHQGLRVDLGLGTQGTRRWVLTFICCSAAFKRRQSRLATISFLGNPSSSPKWKFHPQHIRGRNVTRQWLRRSPGAEPPLPLAGECSACRCPHFRPSPSSRISSEHAAGGEKNVQLEATTFVCVSPETWPISSPSSVWSGVVWSPPPPLLLLLQRALPRQSAREHTHTHTPTKKK